LPPREGGWKCIRYSGATTAISPTENLTGEANSNNAKMERMFAALLSFRQMNEYPAYRTSILMFTNNSERAPVTEQTSAHKARGRPSNRSLNAGISGYAVELVRTRYAYFGPTLATEGLLEKHSLRVGRETLRRWMVVEGLWLIQIPD
jgi:hypothetical protein